MFAAFCLMVRTFAYSFCFTGAETEIHKIKDDSKLREKKTSIAAVRDIL